MPDKMLFGNELKINVLHCLIPQFENLTANKCRNVSIFFPILFFSLYQIYL